MATFTATIALLTRADSLMPKTSRSDIAATISIAGALIIAPVCDHALVCGS